jgi:hypothetical protein
VDSDDRIYPEPVVAKLDLLTGDAICFDAIVDGQVVSGMCEPNSNMVQRLQNYGLWTAKLFRRQFLLENHIRFASTFAAEDQYFVVQLCEFQMEQSTYNEVIYEVVASPDSIGRGPFNERFLTRWTAIQQIAHFVRAHSRDGLEDFERHLVFMSLGVTWNYYLDRGHLWSLLLALPTYLAELRRLRLLRYLGSFICVGSTLHRAFKASACLIAFPFSLLK